MKKRHLLLLLEVKELRDQVDRLTALVLELKEISMSGFDDLAREAAEEKAMLGEVSAALARLVGVVTPLQTALADAQAVIATQTAALEAANANTAALDAAAAAVAAGLNDGQAAIAAELAALPGAPAPAPAPAPEPAPGVPDMPADPVA